MEAFKQLKSRGHRHSPPPMVSDGWGGYDEAMVEVWGEVPEYKGRGRPPTNKRPKAQWQYLQMVKQREKGRVIGMKAKTIYGDRREVLLLLGASTSYVERTNLTSRHMRTADWSGRRFGLLKEAKDAEGVLDLGRGALQPGPGAKDFEGREPGI